MEMKTNSKNKDQPKIIINKNQKRLLAKIKQIAENGVVIVSFN